MLLSISRIFEKLTVEWTIDNNFSFQFCIFFFQFYEALADIKLQSELFEIFVTERHLDNTLGATGEQFWIDNDLPWINRNAVANKKFKVQIWLLLP